MSRCSLPGPACVAIDVTVTAPAVRTWSILMSGGSSGNSWDQVKANGWPRAAAASVSPVDRIARKPRFPRRVEVAGHEQRSWVILDELAVDAVQLLVPVVPVGITGAVVWTTQKSIVRLGSSSFILTRYTNP